MNKLDWMYKSSSSVDPEEYLLGRAIDKHFESRGSTQNEIEKDILPTPIISESSSNVHVDVFRKLKEDPLEQIKQKEIEFRKQILKNPVKLKKLQKMLSARAEKKARKEHKKKKNKDKDIDDLIAEKYKKLSHKLGTKDLIELSKDSTSESEDDIDDRLTEKYAKLISKYGAKNLAKLTKSDSSSDSEKESSTKSKKAKKKKVRSSSSDSSSSDDSNHRDRDSRKHKQPPEKSVSSSQRKHKSRDRSPSTNINKYRNERKERNKRRSSSPRRPTKSRHTESAKRSRDRSSEAEDNDRRSRKSSTSAPRSKKDYDYSSDEEKSAFKKTYGLVLPKGVNPKPASKSYSSDRQEMKKKDPPKYQRPKPSKLTEEEKEARLKEMMDNATWRDKERSNNISRYKEEDKKDDAKNEKFNEHFLRDQLLNAAPKSVEDRIKSNINHLQRSKFSMNQHFAKRV